MRRSISGSITTIKSNVGPCLHNFMIRKTKQINLHLQSIHRSQSHHGILSMYIEEERFSGIFFLVLAKQNNTIDTVYRIYYQ